MKPFLVPPAAILLPVAVGALSGLATANSLGTWYVALEKPPFNPPSWVFGPVWTALYLMMGSASLLVLRRGWERPEVRLALGLYGVQLALNGLWSLLFFAARSPGLALVDIVMLMVFVPWTAWRFFGLSRVAGWLMAPYVGWVGFATVLNASLWWLNRT